MAHSSPVIRLLLLPFRNATQQDEKQILAGLRENFDSRRGESQLRLFRRRNRERLYRYRGI